MPTRNVNLTDHYNHFVESLIASGHFKNASEVMRRLRLLEQESKENEEKLHSAAWRPRRSPRSIGARGPRWKGNNSRGLHWPARPAGRRRGKEQFWRQMTGIETGVPDLYSPQ